MKPGQQQGNAQVIGVIYYKSINEQTILIQPAISCLRNVPCANPRHIALIVAECCRQGRDEECLAPGQTILEYTIIVGIVTVVLYYMGTGIKRGVQSLVKVTADQMGNQQNSDQDFNDTQQGYMEDPTP